MVSYKDIVFLIGGHTGYSELPTVLIYSTKDGPEYTINGPDMNVRRRNHACGIMLSEIHDDRPLLVASGGYDDASRNSEFWDFTVPGTKWMRTSKPHCFP